MTITKSLFERDVARSDFVITHTIRHWSGPIEPPANTTKFALLVIAPLAGRLPPDAAYEKTAVVLLARRGYRMSEIEHADTVCLCGEVLSEDVRALLSICRERGMSLINWTLDRSPLSRYAETLWRK